LTKVKALLHSPEELRAAEAAASLSPKLDAAAAAGAAGVPGMATPTKSRRASMMTARPVVQDLMSFMSTPMATPSHAAADSATSPGGAGGDRASVSASTRHTGATLAPRPAAAADADAGAGLPTRRGGDGASSPGGRGGGAATGSDRSISLSQLRVIVEHMRKQQGVVLTLMRTVQDMHNSFLRMRASK
jgi:hypothetical protein